MKNACIGLLFVLLFHAGVWGHSVNVLIAKHVPRVNLSFSQNYAIVIGKNFYGPISSQNQLRLTSGADGIRLTVRNAQTKVHKNLGASKGPIFLVRSLGPGINFNWPKPLSSLKKQPLPPFLKWQQFPSQKGAFVSFRHPSYGGTITYNGPLTLFAKEGINIVETAELENYVTHVVNCELGSESSLHALKAQSVIVRTFALYMVQNRLESRQQGNPNWKFFQLLASPADQAYNCRKRVNDQELPSDLVKKAARETAGLVLLKKNALAKVQYNTGSAKNLPKGVISQDDIIRKAHAGQTYTAILRAAVPGSKVGRYNPSALCTQALKTLFQQKK